MPGLLVNGKFVQVPGVTITSPGEHPKAKLSIRDYQKRRGVSVPWQITGHTTQGKWPHTILPGDSDGQHMYEVADYWNRDPHYGSTHIIIDGTHAVCLTDVVESECYHATTVNSWSVGYEMVQKPDGSIYSTTVDSAVAIELALCEAIGIPFQTTSRVYKTNTIVERLRHGGKDVVGCMGHRDNAWKFPQWLTVEQRMKYPGGYADRGRGDPGDELYERRRKRGCLMFDFDKGEDLAYWKPVQKALNDKHGESLVVDGVCGQKTVASLRKHGLWPTNGVFVERPIA